MSDGFASSGVSLSRLLLPPAPHVSPPARVPTFVLFPGRHGDGRLRRPATAGAPEHLRSVVTHRGVSGNSLSEDRLGGKRGNGILEKTDRSPITGWEIDLFIHPSFRFDSQMRASGLSCSNSSHKSIFGVGSQC